MAVFMVMTERALNRVSTACSLMARGKQVIGTFFRQHNGSCIGIAANDVRHYRGVNHGQTLDAHNLKVLVNDFTNAAGARGVVNRGFATNIGHERLVIVEVCFDFRREATAQIRSKLGLIEYVE